MKPTRLTTLLMITLISLSMAGGVLAAGEHWGQPDLRPALLTDGPNSFTNTAQAAPDMPTVLDFPLFGPPAQGDLPPGDGPWVVKAYYPNPAALAEFAAMHEPWEVNRQADFIIVDADRSDYAWLLDHGFQVTVDAELTEKLTTPNQPLPGQVNGIPGYPCYRTVEETYTTAQLLATTHPELVTWIDIGDSWEKATPGGLPGYDLRVLRLTNSAVPGPKPKLFIMASIHAREYTPAELTTRFAEELVAGYDIDPDITWLLDYHEIHLLLQSNPDGRKHAESIILWRKNTNENYCSPTSSDRGADLNRNFSFQWGCCGGSSGSECAETYRGPSPASEPEVQAVQNYIRAQFPDQRGGSLTDPAPPDATGVFIDLHSYSELVLWPWGFTSTTAPNAPALQTLGRKFAYFNNYTPDQSVGLYPTDGTTDDFAYGELGLAAYTFEMGTNFFQNCSSFENQIVPENLPALIYAAKVARTPYLTPAGPEALNLSATPDSIAVPAPFELTAELNDTRFNNSNGTEPVQAITAAQYFIDTPPWSTSPAPAAQPMSASDGAFDESIESVQASVTTGGLAPGRHILYVQGQDETGNWGPISALFFEVIDPASLPVIEGTVRAAGSLQPLAATVNAGPFKTNSDPNSGMYSLHVVSDTYQVSAIAPGYAISTAVGVSAADYTTTQQDFNLYPLCTLLAVDAEQGVQGWIGDPPWAITQESAHSPSYAWSDSPGGSYSANTNAALLSPPLDFSQFSGVTISFWHRYQLENSHDFGYVEYSRDGGATWQTLAEYTGLNATVWRRATLQIPELDGQADARLRFRLSTDASQNLDGWYIDDIQVSAGSPNGCLAAGPVAEFSASSPAITRRPVQFTDLSMGTGPLTYTWNFGDGLGFSSASAPDYTYAAAGVYTVTLTVTDTLGSDSVSHALDVQPCTPLTGATLAQAQPNPLYAGETLTLTVDLAPDSFTRPYTYTLDFDGLLPPLNGSSSTDPLVLQQLFLLPGTYPLTLSAWNCSPDDIITDTLSLQILSGPVSFDLTPLHAEQQVKPGGITTYTLTLVNTASDERSFSFNLSGLWAANLTTSDGKPPAGGLTLQAYESATLWVSVQTPAGADDGAKQTTRLTVSTSQPEVEELQATLTTQVRWQRLFLPVSFRPVPKSGP